MLYQSELKQSLTKLKTNMQHSNKCSIWKASIDTSSQRETIVVAEPAVDRSHRTDPLHAQKHIGNCKYIT